MAEGRVEGRARERGISLLPFGPVHPALKEPAMLALKVEGERVVGAEVKLSYVYRSVEALARTRNAVQVLHLVARVCGICSEAHTLCYAQAVESLAGVEAPERAAYVRTLFAELERIQSHLLWFGFLGYQLGLLSLFMYAWRIRERVLNVREAFAGNRVLTEINTIGGVRRDLDERAAKAIKEALKSLRKEVRLLADALYDRTVESRLSGVSVISREEALKLGLVGPTARASGVEYDVRKAHPYAAYSQLGDRLSVAVRRGGDSLARVEVRLDELSASINLAEVALSELPPGEPNLGMPPARLLRMIRAGEVESRVEAPRGELTYRLRSDDRGFFEDVMIRTPTLVNAPALERMVVGHELADVPAIVVSIDPCIACADRVLVVDARSGSAREVSLAALSKGGRSVA